MLAYNSAYTPQESHCSTIKHFLVQKSTMLMIDEGDLVVKLRAGRCWLGHLA